MKRITLVICLLIIPIIMGCKMMKNGLGEPQSLQQQTLPKPHYDSAVIITGWNAPYVVLTTWENQNYYDNFLKAKPNARQTLPVPLRTYTIPLPTKN